MSPTTIAWVIGPSQPGRCRADDRADDRDAAREREPTDDALDATPRPAGEEHRSRRIEAAHDRAEHRRDLPALGVLERVPALVPRAGDRDDVQLVHHGWVSERNGERGPERIVALRCERTTPPDDGGREVHRRDVVRHVEDTDRLDTSEELRLRRGERTGEIRREETGEERCPRDCGRRRPVDTVPVTAEDNVDPRLHVAPEIEIARGLEMVQRDVGVEVELDDRTRPGERGDRPVVDAVEPVSNAELDVGKGPRLVEREPDVLRIRRALVSVDANDEAGPRDATNAAEHGREGACRVRLVTHHVDTDDVAAPGERRDALDEVLIPLRIVVPADRDEEADRHAALCLDARELAMHHAKGRRLDDVTHGDLDVPDAHRRVVSRELREHGQPERECLRQRASESVDPIHLEERDSARAESRADVQGVR